MTAIQNNSAIPEINDGPQTGQLASPTTRLVAKLLDTLINGGIVIGIASYMAGSLDAAIAWQKSASPLESFTDSLAGFSLFLALHGYLLARYGQTLGKRVCGIRIVRADRSKVSLWRILLLRVLPILLLSAIPVPYMFPALATVDALLIFHKSRQCLHDQIAGTAVVNV